MTKVINGNSYLNKSNIKSSNNTLRGKLFWGTMILVLRVRKRN